MRLLFFILISVSGWFSSANAQPIARVSSSIEICPARSMEEPPAFKADDCKSTSMWNINPQHRALWVKGTFTVDQNDLPSGAPVGLFILGKAASKAYFNGTLLGQNGRPGEDKTTEIPGRMDHVYFVPNDLIKTGENEITLLLTGHHSLIELGHPMHMIALGRFQNPQMIILQNYAPVIILFGLFIPATFYFGISAFMRNAFWSDMGLMAISFFATLQLLTETLRGLWAYPYPIHDIRLMMIYMSSLGFGVALAWHLLHRFLPERKYIGTGAVLLITLFVTSFIPGFDGKSAFSVFIPTLIGLALVGYRAWRKDKIARRYLLGLSLFALICVIWPGQFLDALFFYSVAILLVFFIFQQAKDLADERRLRREEAQRRERLELALEQAKAEQSSTMIQVKTAGKIERVSTHIIVSCKGAGDYVELVFEDGRQVLHSATLTELETSLPSTFLRVHRSHIVNTQFVKSLQRLASGIGELKLTTGDSLPVSRRIMPKVRDALD